MRRDSRECCTAQRFRDLIRYAVAMRGASTVGTVGQKEAYEPSSRVFAFRMSGAVNVHIAGFGRGSLRGAGCCAPPADRPASRRRRRRSPASGPRRAGRRVALVKDGAGTTGCRRRPNGSTWRAAGTSTPFHTGATISTAQANYDGLSAPYGPGVTGQYRGRPIAAGSLVANAFGLYDVHGNVAELVADCYDTQTTDCNRRVVRGGSWGSSPQLVRSAYRSWCAPTLRNLHNGFRVARTLTP